MSKEPLDKVLIIGGCAFLGGHIVVSRHAKQTTDLISGVEYDADITCLSPILEVFKRIQPDLVIHTVSPSPTKATAVDVRKRDSKVIPALSNVYCNGESNMQTGSNTHLFDFTYAGNLTSAIFSPLSLSYERLLPSPIQESEKVVGEGFFVTNDGPMLFWLCFACGVQGFGL